MALAVVEDWLDRKIKLGTYTETFFETNTVLLKAWPVTTITTIGGVAPDSAIRIDKQAGIIFNSYIDNQDIVYEGGWADADIPLPVSLAINAVFDSLWSSVPGFGLTQAVATSAGEIKKFSVNGISIEYFGDTTTSSSSSSSSSSSFIPEGMQEILKFYRRESMVGAG